MLITTKPYVKVLDKYHYKLLTDFTVVRDNGEVITVPADYVTNGADIPRFFWRLFPPYSPEYFPAVVVHDYLCDIAESANNSKELYKKADIVFKECLIALGVNRIKTSLFYNAVRLHHRLKC